MKTHGLVNPTSPLDKKENRHHCLRFVQDKYNISKKEDVYLFD